MKLKSVRIQNFRVFEDETVNLDGYTCLVGANGAGKSTILAALNVFFGEEANSTDVESLDAEDFHDPKKDVEITVTFSELSSAEQAALSDYARNGELVVTAKAPPAQLGGRSKITQFGSRPGITAFGEYFAAAGAGAKVDELKKLYAALASKFAGLPAAKTKDAMSTALREYEGTHPDDCELLPSSDQFYGFQGTGKLAPYVQWVYIPAVRDARDEQAEGKANALGRLLKRAADARSAMAQELETIRIEAREKYAAMLEKQQPALAEMSASVAKRLQLLSHPGAVLDVRWTDSEKSVAVATPSAALVAGEHGFQGSVARLGHGLQRALIVALLQELADHDKPGAPRLLMGFEEPELHQHPPQVRHIANVLALLSEGNGQVIVTTHSPLFVTGEHFESVRLVRRGQGGAGSRITQPDRAAITERMGGEPRQEGGLSPKLQTLLLPQANEIFFAPRIVIVEGLEDAAYIVTYLGLTSEHVARRFRELGIHIVPALKKSEMARLLAVAQSMAIPAFTIFDCDGDKNGGRAQHANDNRRLFHLLDSSATPDFPASHVFGQSFVAWTSDLAQAWAADVPDALTFQQRAEVDFGHAGDLNKTPLFIGQKLAHAWNAGHRFPSLERLIDNIIRWAEDADAVRPVEAVAA